MTWDFPFWEVLISALLTGLVTWITIRVSLKAAHAQTSRSLAADDRARQEERVTAAVLALVEMRRAAIAATGTTDEEGPVVHARQLAVERARVIVTTCGAPGAEYIVDELIEVLDPLTIAAPGPQDARAYEYSIDVLSSAQEAENLIRDWQEDPAKLVQTLQAGSVLREEATKADHRAMARISKSFENV